MKRELARRLPIVGKWVHKVETLEEKCALLREKCALLREKRDDLKADLAETEAHLRVFTRERDEHRVRLHKAKSRLPVPPEALRLRVHGDKDEITFLSVGEQIVCRIKQLLATEGLQFDSFARVLDFGCGCGRVLRFFEDQPASCKFFATDIDPEAISWCEQHLRNLAAFSVNGDKPPLVYEDNTFDFVYAISVFIHLPEDLEVSWLEELRRITKPGRILLLTVHAERLFRRVPHNSRKELQERGFCHANCGLTSGLPDYYQTSFHTEDYIRRRWSKFFNIRTIAPLGAQDTVLCENR